MKRKPTSKKKSPDSPAPDPMILTTYAAPYLPAGDSFLPAYWHMVVDMIGTRSPIVRIHATFDHLGAAQAYERSLRAFYREQAKVRA